jgi:hypothetical protein
MLALFEHVPPMSLHFKKLEIDLRASMLPSRFSLIKPDTSKLKVKMN